MEVGTRFEISRDTVMRGVRPKERRQRGQIRQCRHNSWWVSSVVCVHYNDRWETCVRGTSNWPIGSWNPELCEYKGSVEPCPEVIHIDNFSGRSTIYQ